MTASKMKSRAFYLYRDNSYQIGNMYIGVGLILQYAIFWTAFALQKNTTTKVVTFDI